LEQEHEVYYFALPPHGKQAVPDAIKNIAIKPNAFRNIKYLRQLSYIPTIRNLTRKYDIDILHIMEMGNSIHAPFSKSKKILLEIMGSDVLLRPQSSGMWRSLYKVCYRFADAVIQDSAIAQEAGLQYGAPKHPNKIIEIGVDSKIFNLDIPKGIARKRLKIGENEKFVFSPRSFKTLYNVDTIIETIPIVVRQIPNVKYVFCKFSGELDNKYQQLLKDLGVEQHVIFAGYLHKEKELPSFYADADVVLSVPSSDSSPGTVYESMACGTPVIISELPWYHGKFEKDEEVVTVPVRDSKKLANTILDVLEGKTELDTSSAYQKVFERINMATENKKLEELYQNILSE
jgi:glycosyltransferase involved in cell wall biosynthesis